jgi:hypothetical protein
MGTFFLEFTPPDAANLKLWVAARTLSGSDGDPVSPWTDLSGVGNHMPQATSSKKPTLQLAELNGLAGVLADGTDDGLRLTAPTGLPSGDADLTMIALCRPTALPNAHQGVIAYGNASTRQHPLISVTSSNTVVFGTIGDDLTVDPAAGSLVDVPLILVFRYATVSELSTVTGDILSHGVSDAKVLGAAANWSATNLELFTLAAVNYFAGYIFEAALYASRLTDAQVNEWGAGLNARWGVSYTPL